MKTWFGSSYLKLLRYNSIWKVQNSNLVRLLISEVELVFEFFLLGQKSFVLVQVDLVVVALTFVLLKLLKRQKLTNCFCQKLLWNSECYKIKYYLHLMVRSKPGGESNQDWDQGFLDCQNVCFFNSPEFLYCQDIAFLNCRDEVNIVSRQI